MHTRQRLDSSAAPFTCCPLGRFLALIPRRLVLSAAILAFGAGLVLTAQRQRPTFTPEQEARLQIREVADGLYVIPGFDGGQSGGNVAVRVTGDGVILVDNKFPYSFDFITAQVASVTDQPVRYVLNTHHHGELLADQRRLAGLPRTEQEAGLLLDDSPQVQPPGDDGRCHVMTISNYTAANHDNEQGWRSMA